ncbi:MAG: hypothetical protein IJ155_02280 [Prevotella sp.]|nr:hypothetical protein [Prevotella sp.]
MATRDNTYPPVLAEGSSPQPAEPAAQPAEPAALSPDRRLADLTVGEFQQLQRMTMAELLAPLPPEQPLPPAEDADRILFDFQNITKKEIYMLLLAIVRQQGFRSSNAQLIRFLARHTNLGSEHSIHALFYEYQKAVY